LPIYEVSSGGGLIPLDGPFEVLADGVTLGPPLQWRDNGPLPVPGPPSLHTTGAATDPTDLTSRTVAELNWDAPVGGPAVTGYEVFRDDVLVTGALTEEDLTYTNSGLPTATPERTFVFEVRAVGVYGPGPFSNAVVLQWSGTPTQPPSPPYNLTFSNLLPTSVSLSWAEDAVAGGALAIAGHRVYYAPSVLLKGGPGDLILPNVRTTSVTGLTEDTTYTGVYVTRYDTDGNESGGSNTRTFSTPSTGGPPRETVPGQIPGQVIWGMATDNYAARVAETGPVGAEHNFVGTWSPSTALQKIEAIHDDGLLPYMGMKVHGGDGGLALGPNLWQQVANGALDASCTQFAQDLAALNYPIRLGFHHEPAGNKDGSGAEGGTLTQWVNMQLRLFRIIKPIAPNVVLGPIDNGFKWSSGAQGFSDAQLNAYYTEEFLAEMMVHGADYYDGATTRTNGERAAIKAANAAAWMDRRNFSKPMDSGEWQFVRPSDCAAMWSLVSADPDRWWLMIAFNSDTNNRANIPTIGAGWNFTHGYDTANDRLNAFRSVLADPVSYP
jgi:hypothetical protein